MEGGRVDVEVLSGGASCRFRDIWTIHEVGQSPKDTTGTPAVHCAVYFRLYFEPKRIWS